MKTTLLIEMPSLNVRNLDECSQLSRIISENCPKNNRATSRTEREIRVCVFPRIRNKQAPVRTVCAKLFGQVVLLFSEQTTKKFSSFGVTVT